MGKSLSVIKITAVRIKKIPVNNLAVNTPLKTTTLITTAVAGSKAPIIAVGTEPILGIAILRKVMAIIVGTIPRKTNHDKE